MFSKLITYNAIDDLLAIDPTITWGTGSMALATATGRHIFGQLGGITVRQPAGLRSYSYREYRVDLAPNVRVEYRDEFPVCFAVFPVDAVLGCTDTTPYFFPPHDALDDRMWE
jgi:hypothetical protein